MGLYGAIKSMRAIRPYKGYMAIEGLERPGGGPRGRYRRVLHKALKGLIRAFKGNIGNIVPLYSL